jgi:hypothetical protein
MANSKALGIDDISGFDFTKEMLKGDYTYGINFDRVQWDAKHNKYIIVELLLCDESQDVSPFTSHPNRYFHKNSQKFISLWDLSQKMGALLYLVNYAKKGTRHADKILFMRVKRVDKSDTISPVKTENFEMTREQFSYAFRKMNARGKI